MRLKYLELFLLVWGGVTLLFLGGCQPAAQTPENNDENLSLTGRIMVWHSWPEDEAAALQAQIDSFERVNPDVRVIVATLTSDEILDRYLNTAALGLGPDLLIGQNEWLPTLQAAGTIQPIRDPELEFSRFFPATDRLVTLANERWAIPLTLRSPALFINEGLGDTVPQSYDELLQLADEGQTVALNTGAFNAFLGIQAFGKPLLRDDGDSITVQLDGLISWLAWLKEAQNNPNIILSRDQETLSRLFDRGEIAYTIGYFDEQGRFEEGLTEKDEKTLGIAILPSGPNGPSRPLITTEVIYFNQASSDRQHRLARDLARFLTNTEQNNTLMRDVNLVPANQRVRVNSRAYPDIFAYFQAGRNAVSLPPALQELIITTLDESVYTAVLTGVEEPEVAACTWQVKLLEQSPTPLIGDERCRTS